MDARGGKAEDRSRPGAHVQPRVVLGLLLLGSFVGIWIAHGGRPHPTRAVVWSLVVTLGALTGGLYWRLILFDDTPFETPETIQWGQTRWDRLETGSVWLFALAATTWLTLPPDAVSSGNAADVLGAGTGFAVLLWLGHRYVEAGQSPRLKTILRSALFLVGLVSLGGVAWVATGPDRRAWLVRLGHLGSFALWFGGAVWHNMVVLPTIRSRPAAAAPMQTQARRFR